MKRIEKLKTMGSKDLARWINNNLPSPCFICSLTEKEKLHCGSESDCIKGINNWLQQE